MGELLVVKRDCTEQAFDESKIYNAIMKAMQNGSGIIKPKVAESIAKEIHEECNDKESIDISDIELMVFDKLITKKQRLTARAYEGYRSTREFQRENNNTTDDEINELLHGTSEYWNTENSNKNPKLLNTQRDYMAGIVNKDITRRFLLPPEIVQANEEGIIHFHDSDYFAQREHNCDVINLEDMLQCKLFNRSQKGVTLTDEGRILFRQINRPCQQMGRAEEILKEYMNSQSGKVSIGASELTMRFFLLPYIEQFQQRFPNVTVQIHSNSAPITASSLKAGENDFAVIISPIHEIMKELDLVHVMPVAEFQDIVIAGNRFSELQNRTLSLEELCMHPLVSMESGTTTRLFWDNLFEEQGLDLRPSIEVSSNDLIAPTVSHNLGIGFVPSEFARNYLLNYRVFQLHLNIPIPKRQILVLQNPMRPLTPAAQAFLDMLKQPVQESIGNGQPVLLHP